MFVRALAIGAALTAVQGTPAGPSSTFEVATVKQCKTEPDTGGMRRQEWRSPSPGRIVIECIPLRRIIFFAYAGIGDLDNPLLNTNPNQADLIRGGPGWLETDKWTIEAKAPGDAGAPDRTVMMGPMLRALLEERFHLKTHRGTEDAPMFALTVAKGGMTIKPIGPDGCRDFTETHDLSREEMMAINTGPRPVCGNFTAVGGGGNRTWRLGGETLAKFANQTLSSVLDYYVLDNTGDKIPAGARFNINLTFGVDESIRRGVFGGAPVGPIPDNADRGPSIFTALEEQLGLKLEKTRGPRQFLVVDGVQRPDPD
ncbi:MAG TPA: TIGR03435 family protein [Vicinamibacterales bacterium]|nr:TIGR03435 family protein [Vicinamibacterales bacterium]